VPGASAAEGAQAVIIAGTRAIDNVTAASPALHNFGVWHHVPEVPVARDQSRQGCTPVALNPHKHSAAAAAVTCTAHLQEACRSTRASRIRPARA
jgi:hypothetical protein